MGWDQGSEAGKASCPLEYLSLGFCSDWDGSGLAALGPTGLELDMVAFVCVAWLELHGLFPSQAKGPLQLQAHPHVFVFYLVKLVVCEVLGFILVGHKASVRDAVILVGSCNDILLVDLVGPPSDRGHPIFDRSDREAFYLPTGY